MQPMTLKQAASNHNHVSKLYRYSIQAVYSTGILLRRRTNSGG